MLARLRMLLVAVAAVVAMSGCGTTGPSDSPIRSAGPPYPVPVEGVVVYDFAAVLEPATEIEATRIIAGVQTRTGAEIVVYTQIKPESDTTDKAVGDAAALFGQWDIGRPGYGDGLAILFDMDETLCHGQVQLYAGTGFGTAYLDSDERQAIFDEQIVPLLAGCDMDGALLVALQAVDAVATPERAATLESPSANPAASANSTRAPTATPTPTPEESVDPVSGLDWVDIADLPPEAADTLELIETNGPFPFDRDGITFENREGILPDESGGYYHEYTVPTPGESDRGARRIVTGDGGEAFYTGDHYDSFQRIRLP